MKGVGEDADDALESVDVPGTPRPPSLADAQFAELVCLAAWLTACGAGGSLFIADRRSQLAPTLAVENLVHETLWAAGFIQRRAWGRKRRARGFGLDGAASAGEWMLSPALGEPNIVLIDAEVCLGVFPHSQASLTEAMCMWKTLIVAESCAFLARELEDHHLDGGWAQIAEPALVRALEVLPTTQVFNLCWLAVRDVASAYLKFPHSRHELGQTLRQALEQKLAKSQVERWTLRPFGRHARCGESQLAATLSRVLRLDEQYLRLIPAREPLLPLMQWAGSTD